MLLEFKIKNYKSFLEETTFSMVKAAKQSGLDYSLLKKMVKGKQVTGLCSSVVYGPNAAGKTSIIGAMDVFRAIVLRGNIRNTEEKSLLNSAATALELIPNKELDEPTPVEFSVEFIENEMHINYSISLDLGLVFDSEYQRKVLSEKLVVNEDVVFERNDSLQIGNLKVIKKYLTESMQRNNNNAFEIARSSLHPEELFLANGFKLVFSQAFANLIMKWFSSKFMIIYRADSMKYINRFVDLQKDTVYVDKTTEAAARQFGIHSNELGYILLDDDKPKLCSIFKNIKGGKSVALPAEFFESYGTIRFINIFPLVIRAITTGGTLVIDEFDASIHPMALMNIINIFHNDDINIHHAQLIFNTHNPIFLNSNLFRRDEIKFVERDDDSHHSTLYALSDFGTAGVNGVRKHEDYLKNYFISQYGAIKDIDFTEIFETIIAAKGDE